MKKIGMMLKRSKPEAVTIARELIAWLEARDLTPLIPESDAKSNGLGEGYPLEQVFDECELMIVLGGDGTLLAAARMLRGRQVPVLGVNLGSMGFLTEVRKEELYPTLELVLAGKVRIVERIRLKVEVWEGQQVFPYVVLNDVVVTKSAISRIFDLKITVGGNFMNTTRADGLIVSTPTGSTAYNLAVGGPIIHPATKCLVIAPINPHMLTNRPVVVPGHMKIELELTDEAEVFVTCDGQEGRPMHQGDRVTVEVCPQPLLLVKSPKRSYFEVLRQKLHYGER